MNWGQFIGQDGARGSFAPPNKQQLATWRAHGTVRVHEARPASLDAAEAAERSEKSGRANRIGLERAERNERRSASMRLAWARRKAAHEHGLANGGR